MKLHNPITTTSRKVRLVGALALAIAAMTGFFTTATADAPPQRVFAFGGAPNYGAPGNVNAQLVAMVPTPGGGGYWIAGADGGIYTYGNAPFFGSLGAATLNAPVVDMASTTTGGGYWMAARDGGVFTFGDAGFFGGLGGRPINDPIISIVSTPSNQGYWLIAEDGGVFSFGDAAFYGSAVEFGADSPVVGAVGSSTGRGYAMVTQRGSVYAFGDAFAVGSLMRDPSLSPISGISATPSGAGYWLTAEDGGVFTMGDAPFYGSANGLAANFPAVDVASIGSGYVVLVGDNNTRGRLIGTFSSTCYSLRGHTASGQPVGNNVVAVDPRVIRLGTKVYVDGVGFRTALDTGGAIKGRRLDIWKPTRGECMNWGRRTVKVYAA